MNARGDHAEIEGKPWTYDYSKAVRLSDVVMKGGITSGVVYPLAVCEIARAHRLRNIGGTSAGAIAASAAAAAEYGRHSGTGGFRLFAQQPEWLGEGTHLLDLFQPQPRTRRVYRVFLSALAGTTVPGRILRSIWAILTAYWWAAILGAALGAFTLVALLMSSSVRFPWAAFPSAVLLIVVGALLGGLAALVWSFMRNVPPNRFGLCTGYARGSARGTPPLTHWLADLFDQLAGRPTTGRPLTFGDLMAGPNGMGTPTAPDINLRMITTNLSQGTPYRLPFDTRTWFFDPEVFREYFPPRVVQHLVDAANAEIEALLADASPWSRYEMRRLLHKAVGPGLLPLPAAEHLPVVVATRFSLSFPALLSAVPLHVIDYTIEGNDEADRRWRDWLREHRDDWERLHLLEPRAWPSTPQVSFTPTTSWFSDGGITSNFPLPLFDGPIPRWPTFGINLTPFPPNQPDLDVWLPKGNDEGVEAEMREMPVEPGFKAVLAFAHSIIDTMQNWSDNAQTHVPGFRDRVAQVRHTDKEGGLNLNMEKEAIVLMADRGRRAGKALVDQFSSSPPADTRLTWDNHRWVRLRTLLGRVEELGVGFVRAYADTEQDPLYAELIDRAVGHAPYEIGRQQADLARTIAHKLGEIVEATITFDSSLIADAPRPVPDMKVRPRI
jgi:hypothetical protein